VHEVHPKPWGFYKTTLMTPFHQAKILCINPNQSISLQSHNFREEHWVNVKGDGEVILDDTKRPFLPGNYIHIPKGSKHRLINTSNIDNLIISEVQLGESFDENDIIRYEDQYGR
jgi:mannose-1-phosphate guanylyltransferase/mannose-6-phosphate isomerase